MSALVKRGVAPPIVPFPPGPFSIVLADPPWSYGDKGIRGAAEHHYKTMSVDELCALPVPKICAPNCALFMWATWPTLPDALRVMNTWGFTYKNCAFAWVKVVKDGSHDAIGLGHYTRSNTEPCLLGLKGRMQRVSAAVRQVVLEECHPETIFAPRLIHSAKPPIVRERIVQLLGDLPRVELFARERAAGWISWGLECPEECP